MDAFRRRPNKEQPHEYRKAAENLPESEEKKTIPAQRLFNPYEWLGLQEIIRSKYRNEADRALFDALLSGSSGEALSLDQAKKETGTDEFPLEFFNT